MTPIANHPSKVKRVVLLFLVLITASGTFVGIVAQRATQPDLTVAARAGLAQLSGTIIVKGVTEPVEVLRDTWGIPHIYAKNTEDLFFAQGFTVAQDRMWQLEMWRRNAEGKLAEVLGSDYVTRDKFARLLQFRGNWDDEFTKYHPEGRKMFDSFARGINTAIQLALDQNKVPVEFQIMGFRPAPEWTAKTVLTRMPGWTLSRNASSEVQRVLDIKAMGVEKLQELKPTDPETKFVIPEGLNLDDIEPAILGITTGANNLRWTLTPPGRPSAPAPSAARSVGPWGPFEGFITPNPWLMEPELGSNNWVIGGNKSATGMPLLANDPHREVVNPALRYVVHLNAPGWDVIGATEPGLPGITIGHNDRLAWGFTILGMDQQDLYVEETDPQNPNRYMADGQWRDMTVERQLIWVRGQAEPVQADMKFTRHGPVLYESPKRRRAFALRWVGAEPGGAGYLGSLNVMQTRDWKEFNAALPGAWYIPSHSLVYADVEGNYGYVGVALTPVRKNWNGLLPVPGKDGKYEWDGFVPFDKLPKSLNGGNGFYNSSNNDVVPRIVPGYSIPLGYEYGAPYRYDRVHEVLSQKKKFTVRDMELLQQDTVSLPARALVPLLEKVTVSDPAVQEARKRLLGWNYSLHRDSVEATIYELWALKLGPLAFGPRVPENAKERVRQYDMRRLIRWLQKPDREYGADPQAGRDRILVQALEQAVSDLRKRLGDDMKAWKWGDLHTADFQHPLGASDATKPLFHVDPVRRGGDGFTVMNSSNPSQANTNQNSGASFMFVFDVQDWDRSTGLSAPGNSAQPLSPHYSDLASAYWGDGKYFPLFFSRSKVEQNTTNRLVLHPLVEAGNATTNAKEPQFELLQPELFSKGGAIASAWADFDNDGDLDLFVGSKRGELSRLYRNDAGAFLDVAAEVGVADSEEGRSVAWGDFDSDGNVDLYVGFLRGSIPNKLYRNDGGGKHFTDIARRAGVDVSVNIRQVNWIDYDNDGDLDLYIDVRNAPNKLFMNEGGHFTDVAEALGAGDPRKTVATAWFDFDQDGDLDLFTGNQDGDTNGAYRNDGTKFVDVAEELGLREPNRAPTTGTVAITVVDYDNDGDLDIFNANYGPNALYRNDGGKRFVDVAPELGIAGDTHSVGVAWGDYDNDGWPDFYTTSYLAGILGYRDYLFRSIGGKMFGDVIPALLLTHDGDHSVQWADYDRDGDLDLVVASEHPRAGVSFFRNVLPADRAHRALEVMVFDDRGHYTRAGSEIRVYAAGTRKLLGTRIVDTSTGYNAQNAMPVHFGLPEPGTVDVEIAAMTRLGRKVSLIKDVDPAAYIGRWLIVKVSPITGQISTEQR